MKHKWKTVRQGGDPAAASSYERITFCEECGDELNDDNRDEECQPYTAEDMGDAFPIVRVS